MLINSYKKHCTTLKVDVNDFVCKELQNIKDNSLILVTDQDHEKITDKVIYALFETLLNIENQNLYTIDLSYNRLTDKAAKTIAIYIKEKNYLKHLSLKGNDIKQEGCISIAEALLSNDCDIISLDLSHNDIGNEGINILADVLAANPSTLLSLNINDCHIKQEALVKVALALHKNNNLLNLNIDNPLLFSLQQETVIHIAQALQYNQVF